MADDYNGAKLRITTEEGTYEGIVHTIDINRRKLTLTKVVSFSNGKPPKSLHGFHNFFGHELNNLEILEKDETNEQERKQVQTDRNVHQTTSSLPTLSGNRVPSSTPPGSNAYPSTLSGNNVNSTFPTLPPSTSSVNNAYPSYSSGYDLPESRLPDSRLPDSRQPDSRLPDSSSTVSNTPSNFPAMTRNQARPNQPNKVPRGQSIPGPAARAAQTQAGVFKSALQSAGVQFKKPMPAPGTVTKDASDDGDVLLKRPPLAAEQYLENDFYFDDGEELSPQSPPKTVILDVKNDRFFNAIQNISSQRVVGLSCEGVNLGRHGKVCWLLVGCRHFTYLFDILSLGGSCFDQGLAEILENGNILKVTHDCRQMSDALFHQYSIKLINVFDTQVADIIICKQERGGNLPSTVNGLVYCLYEYLNLSPEECHFQKVRTTNMKKDAAIWSRRPLPHQVIDAAAKHVMYLRELRLAQMERMIAEFIYGVNIYLSLIRDGRDYKVDDKKHVSKSRQVPPQFRELYKFQHRHRARKYDEENNDAKEEDFHPVKQSAWQEGGQFTETYKNVHGHIKEQSAQPLPGWDEIWQKGGRGKGAGTNTDEEDEDEQEDSDNDGFEFSGFGGDLRNDMQRVNISKHFPQFGEPQGFTGGAMSVNSDFGPKVQGSRDTVIVETRDTRMHNNPVMGNAGLENQGAHYHNEQAIHGLGTRDTVVHSQGMRTSGMQNQGIYDQRSFHQGINDQSIHGQEARHGETLSRLPVRKDISSRTDSYSKTSSNSAIFKEDDFPPLSDSDSSASNFSTPPRPKHRAGNPREDTCKSPASNSYSQKSHRMDSNEMNLSNSRSYTNHASQDSVTHNARQGNIAYNTQQGNVDHNARQDNFTRNASQDNLTQHAFEHSFTHDSRQGNFTQHASRDNLTHNASYVGTHDSPQDVRFKSQSPNPSLPYVGRGRATLFQHMSHIPQARLPRGLDEEPVARSQTNVGGLASRHSFPTDSELLATPQVTLVNHSPDFIPGGARVRIRQTNEPGFDQE